MVANIFQGTSNSGLQEENEEDEEDIDEDESEDQVVNVYAVENSLICI